MPRPTSPLINGVLLAASLILLAANLATGHTRGAIYATVAVIAFGSLLTAGIREKHTTRDEQPGPQIPLDDDRPPLWRRVLARLLGVRLDRDNH